MTILRKKFDKLKYDFLNAQCLGASCFQPGEYQTRGATSSGSRSTGSSRPVCMRRAYHGCPSDTEYSAEVEAKRKAEGWRVQR